MAGAEGAVAQYDQTASMFCTCRQCPTHIALYPECLPKDFAEYIVVKNRINLKTDTPENHSHFGHITFANVSCTGCNMVLGRKFIQVAAPFDFFQEGNVKLLSERLLFWNRQEMLNAAMTLPLHEIPEGQ